MSAEIVFLLKSGASVYVTVDKGIEDEQEFKDLLEYYAENVLADEGSVLSERSPSGDLLLIPVNSIEYVRGRWL